MSSDPQDRPKLDLPPAPKEPLALSLEPLPQVPQDAEPPTEKTVADVVSEPVEAVIETVEHSPEVAAVQADLDALKAEKEALLAEIDALKQQKQALFEAETGDLQAQVQRFMAQSLQHLEAKQAELQKSVTQLERRRDRIREEMRTTFAGTSQEIAVRVQGFKDYLIGSLQDLVIASEQLDLPNYDQSWAQATPAKPEPEP